jgi:hypothetical protein
MDTKETKELMEQRATLLSRISRIEDLKETVKPEIYQKVRSEYDKQLGELNEKLKSSTEFIQTELNEIEAEKKTLLSKKKVYDDELEEADFRHSIGELTTEDVEGLKSRNQQELSALENRLQEIEGKIKSLHEMMGGEAPVEAPPAAPVTTDAPKEEGGLGIDLPDELGSKIDALVGSDLETPAEVAPEKPPKEVPAEPPMESLADILKETSTSDVFKEPPVADVPPEPPVSDVPPEPPVADVPPEPPVADILQDTQVDDILKETRIDDVLAEPPAQEEKVEEIKEEAKVAKPDAGEISLDEILWDEGKLEDKPEAESTGETLPPPPGLEEITTPEEPQEPIEKEGEGLVCPKCKTVNQADNWYCEKCGTELLVGGSGG